MHVDKWLVVLAVRNVIMNRMTFFHQLTQKHSAVASQFRMNVPTSSDLHDYCEISLNSSLPLKRATFCKFRVNFVNSLPVNTALVA